MKIENNAFVVLGSSERYSVVFQNFSDCKTYSPISRYHITALYSLLRLHEASKCLRRRLIPTQCITRHS